MKELGTWVPRKEVRGAWTLNSPGNCPPALEPHDWSGVQWREKARGSPGPGRGECGLAVLSRPAGSLAKSLRPLPSQGKFIRINFDVAGYIVGANIETCILTARRGAWLGGRGVAAKEGGSQGGWLLGSHRLRKTGVRTRREPWLPAAQKLCLSFPLCRRGRILEPQEGAERQHLHMKGGGQGLPELLGEGQPSLAMGRRVRYDLTIEKGREHRQQKGRACGAEWGGGGGQRQLPEALPRGVTRDVLNSQLCQHV